jgi:hypothetical protein
MLTRGFIRRTAWAKVALAMVLVSSFAALAETSASGTTSVTLYVATVPTGSSSCLDSSDACSSIQDAINVAEESMYQDDSVTISVAAGSYEENDTITLPSNETLEIQGAGYQTTLVYPQSPGSVFTIDAIGVGESVTFDGLSILNGQGSNTVSFGDSYGGGIDDVNGTNGELIVSDSYFNDDSAQGANSAIPSNRGGDAYGGAIYDASGELELISDTFLDDTATGGNGDNATGGTAWGGAVYYSGGQLYAQSNTFSSDSATGGTGGAYSTLNGFTGGSSLGGAIYDSAATSDILLSTFGGDTASGGNGGMGNPSGGRGGNAGDGMGGGLYDNATNSSLLKDTFETDHANGATGGTGATAGAGGFGEGGGYYATGNSEVATLTDDTFYENLAHGIGTGDGIGGAIDDNTVNMSATNVTIAANSVTTGTGSALGAGIYNDSATVTVANSILDQSDSCDGTAITDGSYNVESDTSCALAGDNNSNINLANSLAANGSNGPKTLAIDYTSSAYEEVPSITNSCTYPADERGEPRPGVNDSDNSNCDAGAFEWQGFTVTYNPNTGSGGPTDPNTYGPGDYVNVLFSNAPMLTGFGFGGWCSTQPTSPGQPCTGTLYTASAPGSIHMGMTNLALYAVWDTPVTLYVNSGETGTTCLDASPDACPTIQGAITKAETYTGSSVTVDVSPGTYANAATIDLPTSDTLEILGTGANVAVDDGYNGPDFTVTLGVVTIENLTIENGGELSTSGNTMGGGIKNLSALTVTNDTFSDNEAGIGGGIYNEGIVTATNDTFSGNEAEYGGGIYNSGGLTSLNDTFIGNSSNAGGAIFNFGTATTSNDTFTGDTGTVFGDAIYDEGGARITVSNSILDEVSSCAGAIIDGGYNVESDASCSFASSPAIGSATINLATTLAANGSSGPETLAIDPTSAAYQEVPLGDCILSTDERGDARPGVGSSYCDAGAFEYTAPPYIAPPAMSTTTTILPTTTTTQPTTTTTLAPRLVISYISGVIVPGARSTLTIGGGGFYAQPTISIGVAGLTFVVARDTGTVLITYVTAAPGFKLKPGAYTLTVQLANGKRASRRHNFL